MSQQQCLRGERLVAQCAGEVRQAVLQPVGFPLLGRLQHLIAPAAAEPPFVQVGLLVIGQTGQVVELLVALVTLVDGASPVAALVRQQLGLGFVDGVALETCVRSEGAGLWDSGLFLMTPGLTLHVHSFRRQHS